MTGKMGRQNGMPPLYQAVHQVPQAKEPVVASPVGDHDERTALSLPAFPGFRASASSITSRASPGLPE